jgi:hypothetical protein
MAGYSSVTAELTVGLLGTLGGTQDSVQRGYVLADAAAVGVGLGVVYDSSDASVQLPSTGSQKFMGVAIIDPTVLEIGVSAYVTGDRILTTKKCPLGVWVATTEAVDAGDAVYLQHTANGGRAPGTFRTDSDSSNADQVESVRWAGSYGSGKALLILNLP